MSSRNTSSWRRKSISLKAFRPKSISPSHIRNVPLARKSAGEKSTPNHRLKSKADNQSASWNRRHTDKHGTTSAGPIIPAANRNGRENKSIPRKSIASSLRNQSSPIIEIKKSKIGREIEIEAEAKKNDLPHREEIPTIGNRISAGEAEQPHTSNLASWLISYRRKWRKIRKSNGLTSSAEKEENQKIEIEIYTPHERKSKRPHIERLERHHLQKGKIEVIEKFPSAWNQIPPSRHRKMKTRQYFRHQKKKRPYNERIMAEERNQSIEHQRNKEKIEAGLQSENREIEIYEENQFPLWRSPENQSAHQWRPYNPRNHRNRYSSILHKSIVAEEKSKWKLASSSIIIEIEEKSFGDIYTPTASVLENRKTSKKYQEEIGENKQRRKQKNIEKKKIIESRSISINLAPPLIEEKWRNERNIYIEIGWPLHENEKKKKKKRNQYERK